MAHNSLVRGGVGSGAWTNYVVLHGVMEQLDQYVFQSINGDLGGTWAPSSVITVGGLGMAITTRLDVSGAATLRMLTGSFLTVDGTSGITGSAGSLLTWSGTTTFGGAVTFNGSAPAAFNANVDFTSTVGFNDVNPTHAVHFFGGQKTDGTATFNGAVAFAGGALTLVGGSLTTSSAAVVNLNTTTNIGGTLTIAALTILTGSAHIRYRAAVTAGLDTTATIAVTDGDFFRPPAITADRIWTVTDGTAGDSFEVSLLVTSGAGKVTLRRQDASDIIVMQNTSGKAIAAKFVCTVASGWVVLWTVGGPAVT